MDRKHKLSTKQKRFAKEIVSGNTQVQAVINAGYNVKNRKYAADMGYELMKNPKIITEIDKAVQDAGLKDEYIGKTLFDITERGKMSKVRASDALKALDMALKLRDRYPAEKKQIERYDIRAQFKGKSAEEIRAKYQQFKQEQRRFSNSPVEDPSST